MSKPILYFLIFILICLIFIFSWICCSGFCGIGGCSEEDTTERISQVAAAAAPASTAALWAVRDGSTAVASADTKIDFEQSSFAYLPLGASVVGLVDKTATYLKNNKDRSLNVTGHYSSSENNTSILPTLGLARANQIKKLLVDRGVSADQVVTSDLLVDGTIAVGDTLFSGIDLGFEAYKAGDDSRLATIKSELFGKPIILYFQTGSDALTLSTEQRRKFSDVIYYLDNVSESSVKVEGHTDSRGNRAKNLELSKERAATVKKYLASNGIGNARMKVNGFGPDNPIGDNERSKGREKNRRVEVILN